MKQLLFISLLAVMGTPCKSLAQQQGSASGYKTKFGFTGGMNFFSINGIKSVDLATKNSTGFFVGAHYSVPAKLFGYRTEVLYSRQGYDYRTSSQAGGVMLDYLVLPQLTTMNITKFFQVYAGAQVAFLMNTKVDSLPSPSSVPNLEERKNHFAKINYGFAAGLEVKPFAGLLVGGRYNLFLNLFKDEITASPSYLPKYDGNLKNGLVQLYVGYQF